LNKELSSPKERRFIVPVLLVFTLLVILLGIELTRPYFFLQDDNRDYYLPYFVHNFDSLMSGELAQYNFHQFMGVPSMAMGQTGALYPFTYVSVALSRLVFGHVFAAADILVVFHLIVAGVGVYLLLRHFRASPVAAFFGGLTWPISSFVVFTSNSWVIVSAVAAYFPLILLFAFRDYRSPSRAQRFFGIIVRLLLFYNGHIQYFIYSVIFESLTMLVYIGISAEKGKRKKFIGRYFKRFLINYIIVFFLALPLLLPMWHAASISADRSVQVPVLNYFEDMYPLEQLIMGLFFPFFQAELGMEVSYRNLMNLSHIGYVAMGLIIVGLVGFIVALMRKSAKETIRKSPEIFAFAVSALIGGLWATSLLFNRIIYLIPILNRFRWSFKLAFYLDFFLILIAALILSEGIRRYRGKAWKRNCIITTLIGIQILNFWLLYTVMPYKDFGEHHGDSLPLVEPLRDDLNQGRILSVGFDTWTFTQQNDYPYLTAPTIGFNYATLWKLDYWAGYEPLLPATNEAAVLGMNFNAIYTSDMAILQEYFRETGVRWYIFPAQKTDSFEQKYPSLRRVSEFSDDFRSVFCDDEASPLIYTSEGDALETTGDINRANTLQVDIEGRRVENITFVYIYNPFLKAYADNQPIPITAVNGLKFEVSVPEGTSQITIKYEDPYFFIGLYIAAAFLFLLSLFRVWEQFRKKDRSVMNSEEK